VDEYLCSFLMSVIMLNTFTCIAVILYMSSVAVLYKILGCMRWTSKMSISVCFAALSCVHYRVVSYLTYRLITDSF